MYVDDGGDEQVKILDHASGEVLSSFGRPGHQLGAFTHGGWFQRQCLCGRDRLGQESPKIQAGEMMVPRAQDSDRRRRA
jgi:hypothetical protein